MLTSFAPQSLSAEDRQSLSAEERQSPSPKEIDGLRVCAGSHPSVGEDCGRLDVDAEFLGAVA